MRIYSFSDDAVAAEARLRELENRGSAADPEVAAAAAAIVEDVRLHGSTALREYAMRFEGLPLDASLWVSRDEMEAAWHGLSPELKSALELAAARIRTFAEQQRPREWSSTDDAGMTLGVIVRPISSVACYVPGGRHSLPSSLLMTAVPAQVAGVRRIAVISPKPGPAVLGAAHMLGITEFLQAGGAQGIAAAAYGNENVTPVEKICGPGGAYVTAAKQIIDADTRCRCTIDMAAGPTETLIASDVGNPEAIAADLVAQAEHGPDSIAVFVTTLPQLSQAVRASVRHRAADNLVAQQSLEKLGAVFVARDKKELADIVNRIACEHLTVDADEDLAWVRNAGSVFVGTQTPQALGDYISGPNHTLPTAGAARWRGGLTVADFMKTITVQSASVEAVVSLAPAAVVLARAEGLAAHKLSLRDAVSRSQAVRA